MKCNEALLGHFARACATDLVSTGCLPRTKSLRRDFLKHNTMQISPELYFYRMDRRSLVRRPLSPHRGQFGSFWGLFGVLGFGGPVEGTP